MANSVSSSRIAASLLSKNNYTVYRRQNNKPVSVRLIPLNEVKEESLTAWKNYSSLHDKQGQIKTLAESPLCLLNGLVSETTVAEQLKEKPLFFRLGLMEGDILHAYMFLSINLPKQVATLEDLYVAPWNFAGRDNHAEELRKISWHNSGSYQQLAVKGCGWNLMAFACANVKLAATVDPAILPFSFRITNKTDAKSFYEKIIGAQVNGDIGRLGEKEIDQFLQKASLAASFGRPGWKMSKTPKVIRRTNNS